MEGVVEESGSVNVGPVANLPWDSGRLATGPTSFRRPYAAVGRTALVQWRSRKEGSVNDSSTKKPLQVSDHGTAGPYLWVPVSQLAEVQRLLDAHGVKYWVEEDAISLDDEPEETIIDFGPGADGEAVQRILDALPDF